ncbi:MAG: alkaline phosphatase D family protein [Planctomycetaceae bacterium]
MCTRNLPRADKSHFGRLRLSYLTGRLCYPLLIWGLMVVALPQVIVGEEPISRIGFGSCIQQDLPQPIWKSVLEQKPERFLLIGDNIYGDSDDMAVLKQKWERLAAEPGFQALRELCPVLATWDDHDFGRNDAGVEYEFKRESQQVFLDFLNTPADAPRRTREGVYDAEIVGPEGRRVQFILLDTRYFRSPLIKRDWRPEPGEGDFGPYARNTDPSATVLGADQWKWFEEQLRQPAEVRIIASSIQLISDGNHWEKWGNFPLERQRMFEVIRATKATGCLFISGDRHSAEISVNDPGTGYELIDVTSSSINKPSKWHTEANEHRRGTKYYDENFGMITIDWTAPDPVIRCQVLTMEGKVALQHRVTLSQLRPVPTAR